MAATFVVPINTQPVQHGREDLNEFLTLSIRPAPNQPSTVKLLSITNHSPTLKGSLTIAFDAEVPIVPLGRTTTSSRVNQTSKRPEAVFQVDVNPFEKVDVLRGPFITHDGRTVSAGPPAAAFFLERAAQAELQVAHDISEVERSVRIEQEEILTRMKQSPSAASALETKEAIKITTELVAQACSRRNTRFVDLGFPPTKSSLVRDCDQPAPLGSGPNPIIFLRPDDAIRGTAKLRASLPVPSLFGGVVVKPGSTPVQRIDPGDVRQGTLGNCYLCCAMTCLAASASQQLVRDVFSPQQEPTKGIFRVLMCKHGWWCTHVVDEFLPTQSGGFCFTRNKAHPTQLWVAILEKAYARAHGSFAAIRAGDAASALMDLTGGRYVQFKKLPEFQESKEDQNKLKLFEMLRKALREDSQLVTVGTPSKAAMDKAELEAKKKEFDSRGLTLDHAYSVLDAVELNGKRLVLLRDPWSGGANAVSPKVWTGAYGPADLQSSSPSVRAQLDAAANRQVWGTDAQREDQGRFWAPWDELVRYIDNGCICDPLRSDPQVRLRASVEPATGWVSNAMRLRVTGSAPLVCHFAAHQKDRRSIAPTVVEAANGGSSSKSTKPPPNYLGILLSVLLVDVKQQKTLSLVGSSDAKNTFGIYRDVFTETLSLPPNESEDTAYFVVAQCLKSSGSTEKERPLVISAMLREPHKSCAELAFCSLVSPEERIAGTTSTAAFVPPLTFKSQNYKSLDPKATWQARVTQRLAHHHQEDGVVMISTRVGAMVDLSLWGGCKVAPSNPKVEGQLPLDRPTASTLSPEPTQPSAFTVTSGSGPVATHTTEPLVAPQPASCLHLLVLDAVIDVRRTSESNSSARDVALVQLKLVKQPPLHDETQQGCEAHPPPPHCFRTRALPLQQEEEAGDGSPSVGEGAARMDGVVRDQKRSIDDAPAGVDSSCTNAPRTMRAVWCEGNTVPLPLPSSTGSAASAAALLLDMFTIEAEVLVVPDAPKVAAHHGSLAIGAAALKGRRLTPNGTGQMMTVSLYHPSDTAEENEPKVEIGELHLGVSWVTN